MNIRGFSRTDRAITAQQPPTLDASQRAVLALPDDASAAIIGAPGTGKTTTLIELIADRVLSRGWSPDQVLVLSPTRAAATDLRDRLALRLAVPTLGPLARTANSVAFQLVRDVAAALGSEPPSLLTGAEQDQIIADLIAGDEAEGTGPAWPVPLEPEIRGLRGFRTELRDLIMRCEEYGVDPGELARLGRQHNRPEWVAAAEFIARYHQVVALYRNRHFDSAELVQEAAGIVAGASERSKLGLLGRLRLIVLDDAQETTEATLSLLRAFVWVGVQVIAFGDPDISTGSFRGAQPDVLGRLASAVGIADVTTLALSTVHRHGGAVRDLVSAITGRIGAAGAGTQRRARIADDAPPSSVAGIVAGSPAEEVSLIARRLRERHVFDGVAWGDMAVIVRSGSLVAPLERGLAALEVPTRASNAGTAVRDAYAVRAIILLLGVALGRRALAPDTATDLLLGPLGSLDAVTLRRLKAALRQQELAGDGNRSGDELLVDSLRDPVRLATIDTRVARLARGLAASLQTARAEAAAGATIEELLWGVWERSRLSGQWYEQALGTGIVAEEANRNLDAVVALFAAARRFVERTPDYPSSRFLDDWVGAEIAEDTLAPRSALDAVVISTPSAAIGRQFDTVVIAGLQENVWPDLRIRGSLLGAQELADLVSGRLSATEDARLAVMHDELRMFAQAASRATSELMVTAVASDDSLPSPFFRLVPAPNTEAQALHPLSLRGLVGRLRRELTTAPSRDAASALARLAREAIPGADPRQWYGLAPLSTTAPLYDLVGGDTVRVSPSRMASFEECPLHWLIDQVGGGETNLGANLGTLIHKAAEEVADPSVDALWRAVEARWGELSFESRWQSEVQKAAARDMTARLSAYLTDFARAGGQLLGAEISFTLPVGGALLSGTIDRVERLADGAAVIVDLKTGSRDPISDAGVADLPQLGAYQLAFASGAIEGIPADLPSGGAKLVIVSKGTQKKPYYEPMQAPFTAEALEAFRARVEEDADGMAGSVFIAQIGSHCLDPWAYGSCRIHVVKAVSA